MSEGWSNNTSFTRLDKDPLIDAAIPPTATLKEWGENLTGQLKFSRLSTHLANERTFLAWIRTSIAIFSVGFLLFKADQYGGLNLSWFDKAIGMMFVVTGIFCFITGTLRYFKVKEALNQVNPLDSLRRVGVRYLIVAMALIFLSALVKVLYTGSTT